MNERPRAGGELMVSGDENQRNKRLVWEYWQALNSTDLEVRRAAAATHLAPDGWWHGHAPVGSVRGPAAFIAEAWEPLRRSFPDLQREPFIFFGGQSNGRVDGDITADGHMWVTGTGVMHATFEHDYLTIPASGEQVDLRWGEFCRLHDGRIVETYFLIDVVDLMEQAGVSPLPTSLGRPGQYPPPGATDGIVGDAASTDASAYSLDHIRRFIFDGLNAYDQGALASMGMADFFDTDVRWYGPGGIGACHSLEEFEELHQRPWLVAYPDRQVQDLNALFAEGPYSGAPGWAGVRATHTGPYLGIEPTGKQIAFNGLDWWKRNGELYVENWVFVDMVHLFQQFGVDLLTSPAAAR